MKSWKIYNQLFIRLVLILLLIGLCFWLFSKNMQYSAIFCGFIIILMLIEVYSFIKRIFIFYDKTINAILHNDFSADFSKQYQSKNYKNLYKLYEKLKNKQKDQISKELVFRSILNNVETGVLMLQKQETEWNIFLMNDYFSNHFKVPKVSKWHYLKKQLPSLCELIENYDFKEVKASIQVRVGKEDLQTFILQTSLTKTYGQDYYVILLDSIQRVVEKKEKEAWINLMKVISHELMNSLTPIRSLTQNMNDLVQQDELSKEDIIDLKESVNTILNRSDHLQNFVENYRKLAMLPSPKKEKVTLNVLLENSLNLMTPLFKEARISVNNTISINSWLYVDKLQMEQVLINLLTNSIYALKNKTNKEIEISSEVKDKRVFITISDTGKGVEKEIEDKIFLPFFTTRKQGAGIGLTLSKNIIEAHGGYLVYQNEKSKTSFIICLVE